MAGQPSPLERRHDTSPRMTGDRSLSEAQYQTPQPLPKAQRSRSNRPSPILPLTGRSLAEELEGAGALSTPLTFNSAEAKEFDDRSSAESESEDEEATAAVLAMWTLHGIQAEAKKRSIVREGHTRSTRSVCGQGSPA